MIVRQLSEHDLSAYSDWMQKNEMGHVLQSVQWGEHKKENWRCNYFFIEDNDQVVGAYLTMIRRIPILGKNIMYLPRGPIFNDYNNEEIWKTFTEEVSNFGRQENCIIVKIDPAIEDNDGFKKITSRLGFISKKTNYGFGGGIQPAATVRIELTDSAEDLYQSFPKKTRYSVRFSEKNGVIYKLNGIEGLDEFYQTMTITANRANFIERSMSYYGKLMELFGEDAVIVNSYKDDELISSGMYFKFSNKVWALYGGTTGKHSNLQAGYGLEFTAMKWSIEKGAKYFDLFGIPVDRTEQNENNKSVYGIYKFKKSFNGAELDFIGELDLPINTNYYRVYNLLEWGRGQYLKVKKKLSRG